MTNKTRAKSAQKTKVKKPKVITRAVVQDKSRRTASKPEITGTPPLSPGNIFEIISDKPTDKIKRIFVHEIGKSRFFSDTDPKVSERLVTFEEDGEIKELKENEFRKYIEDNKYIKKDSRRSRKTKMSLPKGIKLGDKYVSKDGCYEARVIGGNVFNVKVKITMLGEEMDSSFYRMYEAKNFGVDKIFSDDILTYLGSAYKNLAKASARDIEIFDMSAKTPTDEELREQWRANNKKKQAKAVIQSKAEASDYATPLDKEDEEKILDIFQTPEDKAFSRATQDVLDKVTGTAGFGGTRPMVKMPDIPTEEDLEAFQQAIKEKIAKAKPAPVQTNLFEIVGKTKEEDAKDIRFTILGNDIDTELIKKINERQEVEIFQIKRLAAVDVI